RGPAARAAGRHLRLRRERRAHLHRRGRAGTRPKEQCARLAHYRCDRAAEPSRPGETQGARKKLKDRPGRLFLFQLAARLGKTVGELRATMSAAELAEWQAF